LILMHHMRHGQNEHRYRGLKLLAITAFHRIAALHVTGFGGDDRATGILIALAWRNQGLLSDYAAAFDFVDAAILVGDDPVTAQETHRVLAKVGNGDGIGEGVRTACRIGLLFEVLGRNLDVDVAFRRATAAHGISLCWSTRSEILT